MARYHSRYSPADLQEILSTLTDAGYIRELPPHWQQQAGTGFIPAWMRMEGNSDIAFLSCRTPDTRHIATSMTTRQHPDLWMHHHLSLRRHIRQSPMFPKAISEALAVAFEDTYEAGNAGYVEALCNANKRFNQTLYGGYHRVYPNADDFRLESFVLYDFPARMDPLIKDAEDLSIVPVDLRDIPRSILLQSFSPMTAKAYGLLDTPGTFHTLEQQYRQAGAFRGRCALACQDDKGTVCAWAIIDITTPEPSLFGLCNQTYILPGHPGHPQAAMAKLRLINMASRLYYSQGLHWFKVQMPHPDTDIASWAHCEAEGNRWIGPLEAIPRWVTYLRTHFYQNLRTYYERKQNAEA